MGRANAEAGKGSTRLADQSDSHRCRFAGSGTFPEPVTVCGPDKTTTPSREAAYPRSVPLNRLHTSDLHTSDLILQYKARIDTKSLKD
jgi:hypothetical protein